MIESLCDSNETATFLRVEHLGGHQLNKYAIIQACTLSEGFALGYAQSVE
jgi:hypothetical protein